jgi:hypothetical protein
VRVQLFHGSNHAYARDMFSPVDSSHTAPTEHSLKFILAYLLAHDSISLDHLAL